MANIGKLNTLLVMREAEQGLYLDGDNLGDILIPKRYVPEGTAVDDEIEVFIYTDSEDRIIATTEKPHAMVGEFGAMKVVHVNKFGAFMDWGLMKDLFVPFREQKMKMLEGNTYVVFVYLDLDTDRVAASAKLDQFLDETPPTFEQGEEVEIIIAQRTDLGYKVIINETHWGLIFKNEIFGNIQIGDKRKAYIKNMRDDDKIDVSLQKEGYERIDSVSKTILQKIEDESGFLALTDKSSPEEISATFGISKKAFKKAIGTLYKQRLIELDTHGIRKK
ncbi:MAG: GntR family transcriptional regulator [Bacteroidetes bacterium]|nr:MAG: GntR family transcriptional regulator [Bacteroidota bacterium]